MDWNDLRYFLTSAPSGSLAKAARELSVEHTTVSRRLSLARKGPLASIEEVSGHELIGFADLLSEVEGERWARALKPPPSVVMRGNTIAAVGRDILLVVHPDLVRVARVRATMDFLLELFHRDAALWSGV